MNNNSWLKLTIDGRIYEALEYEYGLFRVRRADGTVIGEIARIPASGNRKEQMKIIRTGVLVPTWTGAIRELDLEAHEQAQKASVTEEDPDTEENEDAATYVPTKPGPKPGHRPHYNAADLPDPTPGWLSVLEAADRYGCTSTAIYDRIAKGRIAWKAVRNPEGAKKGNGGRDWHYEIAPPGVDAPIPPPRERRPVQSVAPPITKSPTPAAPMIAVRPVLRDWAPERAPAPAPIPIAPLPLAASEVLSSSSSTDLQAAFSRILQLTAGERAAWATERATLYQQAREDARTIGRLEGELRALRGAVAAVPTEPERTGIPTQWNNKKYTNGGSPNER